VEVPLPWERLLWSGRALLPPGTRYVLTDFRLVRLDRRTADELVLRDVGDVHRRETWIDRCLGTSTVIVHQRGARRPPLELPHVRRGAQLAALLELLSGDPRTSWDPASVRAALAWEPHGGTLSREAFVGLAVVFVALFAVAIGLHGKTPALLAFPPDDAVNPGGVKRDRDAIVRFMENEVMPWARVVLGPLKGGAGLVTCQTCHGADSEARAWVMPAVAALPQPDVTERGWEVYSAGMDAQMRNAIYGYTAESDNQAKATYMREIVMPGMARLLHRMPYDFTKPYEYNRTRVAFGCYHCHRVN
jgi:hypothetical protein